MIFRTSFLVALFIVSTAIAAMAAQISVTSSSAGVFIVQGSGFTNVGGVDVTVYYDTAKLANPQITKGNLVGSAMFVANPGFPGGVKFAIVSTSPINGSGPLATLTFERLGGSVGKINSVVATMADTNAKMIPVQTSFVNPQETDNSTATAPTTQTEGTTQTQPTTTGQSTTTTGQTTSTTSSTTWLGGVTMPGNTDTAGKEKPTESVMPPPLPEQPTGDRTAQASGEPGESAPEEKPAKAGDEKMVVYKSILSVFKEFKGEKTVKSLVALFESVPMAGIRQEPAIALADGKNTLKLYVAIPANAKESPNFALKSAKLVSLKTEGNNWVLEALPLKNANEATVTMLLQEKMTEIPLVIVQPLPASLDKISALDEKAFALFLKERGTDKAPGFDLNGDKKRDAVDDYIYTATYLIKQNELKKKNESKAPAKASKKAKDKN